MHEMLTDLRTVLREADEGTRTIVQYQRIAWRADGLTRRIVVCDAGRLHAHRKLCAVGFFAERRPDIDITPLEEANAAIVAEFAKYPGILSYSSVEVRPGHWANMVLHDDPVDPEYWRKSALHAKAANLLSPVHYSNVRIHNSELTSGLFDNPQIVVKQIKYFDYAGESKWRGERTLGTSPGS